MAVVLYIWEGDQTGVTLDMRRRLCGIFALIGDFH